MKGVLRVHSAEKEAARLEMWRKLERLRLARFPGAKGQIPRFIGAEEAAERLREYKQWKEAAVVFCNSDPAQLSVRCAALKDGKALLLAIPRLSRERCFIMLNPKKMTCSPREAAGVRGAAQHGKALFAEELPELDLFICGAVAVNLKGHRLGKGGGQSDLEFGLLSQAGKIAPHTRIIATVHPAQVLGDDLPMAPHDFSLNGLATPERLFPCTIELPQPRGIDWKALPCNLLEAMPALQRLKPHLPL